MLMLNPSTLRAAPNHPSALPSFAADAATTANDPAGFASLLKHNRTAQSPAPAPVPAAPPRPAAPPAAAPKPVSARVAPAEAPAPSPAPSDAATNEPAAEAAVSAGPAQRARLQLAARLRAEAAAGLPSANAEPATASETGDAAAVVTEDAAKPNTSPDARADALPAPVVTAPPPATPPWFGSPPPRSAASLLHGGGTESNGRAGLLPDAEPTDAARTAPPTPPGLAAAERDTAARSAHHAADAAAHAERFAAAFATAQSESRQPGKAAAAEAGAALGGTPEAGSVGGSAFVPAPATTPATAAAVTIAAPVTSPEFAHELGLRLSVLARDGLQEAELHLNPADMGPVSVQITMTGSQAHIDFGADLAATRQAIEAGLPELASALRDAGFTLAGGGVSQHSQQSASGQPGRQARDDEPGGHRGARRAAVGDETLARVGGAARRIVTAGGVDLFA